jgi:curved DNA-binding protein CbpA
MLLVYGLLLYRYLLRVIMPSESHYDALGVAQEASQDVIKKAYRALSLELHPDRAANKVKKMDGESEEEFQAKRQAAAENATPQFQKVADAYGVLGDVDLRKAYDLQQSVPAQSQTRPETSPDQSAAKSDATSPDAATKPEAEDTSDESAKKQATTAEADKAKSKQAARAQAEQAELNLAKLRQGLAKRLGVDPKTITITAMAESRRPSFTSAQSADSTGNSQSMVKYEGGKQEEQVVSGKFNVERTYTDEAGKEQTAKITVDPSASCVYIDINDPASRELGIATIAEQNPGSTVKVSNDIPDDAKADLQELCDKNGLTLEFVGPANQAKSAVKEEATTTPKATAEGETTAATEEGQSTAQGLETGALERLAESTTETPAITAASAA